MKIHLQNLEIYENYISNYDSIINLIETKYKKHFVDRQTKEKFFSVEDNRGGGDVFFVNRSHQELFHTIFETINKEITPNYPDYITIYRYKPGDLLKKHKDTLIHDKMITDLIFLQSQNNHLKIYTDQYPNGYFIDEIPGRRIIIPGDLEHEITEIQPNEITRYTMTMSWVDSRFNVSWWSNR